MSTAARERAPEADWRPEWMRTVRFRLSVTYSSLLFGLAALVVGGIYLGVAGRVDDDPLTRTVVIQQGFDTPNGFVPLGEGVRVADVRSLERAANARTLEALRTYSVETLVVLFLASLGIGWWLAGRALRPVAAITDTAAEISATDLSRRIHLTGPEDELRRLGDTIDGMLARLEEAFAAQRQLVDDASHELRNPLAIIRANVDAVLAHEDATPEERAHAVDVVGRATDRMSRLVDDLLATARRAGPAFVETHVDVAAVGREALEEVRATGAGVTLRSGLADGIGLVGDRDALRRAIVNLLSNAVRFSPPDGEVLLACGRRAGWAWVAVRDAGPGLAAEHRERVFERFYRIEGHAASGHAGLGLAIVRQIVESHGGTVAVHSTPGRGATFVLWLPVRRSPEAGVRDAGPAPVATDPLAV